MNILEEIAAATRVRVANKQGRLPLETLRNQALALPRGDFRFEKTLKKEGLSFICEVKKASPSKGIIDPLFPYVSIARAYEAAGADCVSVLTEPQWFLGSDQIFTDIRTAISIPMIRKDFTVSDYQIYESKVMGADAVLLIVSLLEADILKEYLDICEVLGLTALVETHSEEEIGVAVAAGARVIGVNNRNLKNFNVDLSHSARLREAIPASAVFVAESGVSSPEDVAALTKAGADAVLVGEYLMRSGDKKATLDGLRSASR